MSIPDAWSQEIAAAQKAFIEELMVSGCDPDPTRLTAYPQPRQVYHRPPLTHEVREFADDLRVVLDEFGWYDEPENTDPYRRRDSVFPLSREGREGRDLRERYVRHADLLEKWPAEDWWRGA